MMIKATGFRVIVRPDVSDEKVGNIIVPDPARDQIDRAMMTGTVMSIGKDAWDGYGKGEPWAEVGETVVFGKYQGIIYTDTDTDIKYRILNDEDILAKPE